AGADTEGQGPERNVRGSVGVAADDRDAGHGQAQLGAHYGDDALVLVAQRVDAHAELLGVAAQRLDLGARGDVGDRLLDVDRGGVVVLGRDRLIDAAGGTPLLTQPVECLWAGDLVQELEVDV